MSSFVSETKPVISLVARAAKYVQAKPTHPSLGDILVELDKVGDDLMLSVTGMSNTDLFKCKMSVLQKLDAVIDGPVKFCVSPKRLLEVISRLPSKGSAEFVMDSVNGDENGNGQFLEIKSGKGRYKIETANYERFVEFADAFVPEETKNAEPLTTFDSSALVAALSSVSYAMSDDEAKQILCGMNVILNPDDNENDNGCVELAATDGHRLAFTRRENVSSGVEGKTQFNIPASVVQRLDSTLLCGSESETVELQLRSSVAQMTSHEAGAMLAFRVIDGQYPNYPQLVPADAENTVVISALDAGGALARVQPFTSLLRNIVRLELNTTHDGLQASSSANPDASEYACDEIAAGPKTQWNSELFPIAFNQRYIAEAIANASVAATGDSVSILVNTPTSPSVVKATAFDGSDVIKEVHLVMPVQIRSA